MRPSAKGQDGTLLEGMQFHFEDLTEPTLQRTTYTCNITEALLNRPGRTAAAQCSTQPWSKNLTYREVRARNARHRIFGPVRMWQKCKLRISCLDSSLNKTVIHLPEHGNAPRGVKRYLLREFDEVQLEAEGNDTSYTCLNTPRSSARRSSLPQVPDPIRAGSRADRVVRIRSLLRYHWKIANVAAAIKILSIDFPFQECLFPA